MSDQSEPEITVYRFAPPKPTIFDASPFVIKLECILRMTSTPYALAKGDVRKAPKRKLPFISLPTGEQIGDSTLCYKYLQTHKAIPDIDGSLTETEHASAVAYKAWLEEYVYFLMIWDKWIDNWYANRESFFADLIPFYPARVVIFNLAYRKLASMLYTMGITRHSKEEILGFIAEAVKAMGVLVGEKGMFEGKKCSVNAFMMGILVSVYEWPELNRSWLPEVEKYPNLKRWMEGMVKEYFPERTLKYQK